MRIGRDHRNLSALSRNFCLESLADGDVAAMVTRALEVTGRAVESGGPLQPRFVVWLVLGLMLWRSDSVPAVFGRLISGARAWFDEISLKAVTESALTHARKRLGVEPLRALFRQLGATVDPRPSFGALRVWIIDGTHLSVLDTPANLRVFGRRSVSRGRAAFCEVGLVCLVDAMGHGVREAVFAFWKRSEVQAARQLIKHLGAGDLVILDRLFFGLPLFLDVLDRGAQFLCRVSSQPKLRAIRGTRQGHQYEAWMSRRVPGASGERRTGRSEAKIVRLRVRVIDYSLRGHGRVRLVTSLLDRAAYPASELAVRYHRRWEAEIAFDEIKTHQNANAHGQIQTVFRSKIPRNVMQEAYALLAAYNLVRRVMSQAAEEASLDPRRLSFLDSLRAVQWMTPRMQSAPTLDLPRLYRQLMADLVETRLDRFRRPRRYPRVVRVKMSHFKLKRVGHEQTVDNFEFRVRTAVA